MRIFSRKNKANANSKSLTAQQKRAIDKAVKKTVKEYGKTLEMLAKT